MLKKKLSVVIPCYNEEKNIPLILERFADSVAKNDIGKGIELILVDNNSTDNSAAIIRRELKKKKYSFARTLFQPVPGYGSAISKGLSSAKGEYICWTHGDIQTDPGDALIAYDIITKENNPEKCFVKGKRYGRPLFDIAFTVGMSLFDTILFHKRFWDINAQPNLFHRSFLGKMKEPPLDFSFDLYAYYLARKNNYKVLRFPVNFGSRMHGNSTWNTGIAAKWKFIKRTFDFSIKLWKKGA